MLLFGPAKDAALGSPSVVVGFKEDSDISVADLRSEISNQHALLRNVVIKSLIAVENKIIPRQKEEKILIPKENVEIVLIPPVSGG